MKGPKVTLSEIEQEIDLSDFVGDLDLTDERALKESIAQAIIDKIISRTEAGEGMKISSSGQGRSVKLNDPVYSDEYVHSLEFKAAGKKKSKVNMTLTGDMLASVDVLSTEGSKIKIGITDDDQIPKAYNHIVGDTVPERPWFGISKAELRDILETYKQDFKDLIKENAADKADRLASESDTLKALDYLDEQFSEFED